MFGYLAINKPQGWTSRDVVNRVHRLVRPVKVGHTGTLDPLATGVLIVAIGPATRLTEYAHLQSKEYIGAFELHKFSDTLDVDGDVNLVASPPTLDQSDLLQELDRWRGPIQQTPPKYSAINVGGRRAYDLARKGKDFEIPQRTVTIHDLELRTFDGSYFKLRIDCSTGTYVRSLGSDIAKGCGTDAVMSELTRTRVGAVELQDCVELDHLNSVDKIYENLRPAIDLVSGLPRLKLPTSLVANIRNGIKISQCELQSLFDMETTPNQFAALDELGELVGILENCDDVYRSLRVFQNTKDMAQPKSINAPQSPES